VVREVHAWQVVPTARRRIKALDRPKGLCAFPILVFAAGYVDLPIKHAAGAPASADWSTAIVDPLVHCRIIFFDNIGVVRHGDLRRIQPASSGKPRA